MKFIRVKDLLNGSQFVRDNKCLRVLEIQNKINNDIFMLVAETNIHNEEEDEYNICLSEKEFVIVD